MFDEKIGDFTYYFEIDGKAACIKRLLVGMVLLLKKGA